MTNKTAISYVRRSKLAKSDSHVVSIEEQTSAIQQYAAAKGYAIAATVTHNGISGTSGRRKRRFAEIEQEVQRHNPDAVMVYHLDRFGRDSSGVMDYLKYLVMRGIVLHEVAGAGIIDVSTAIARLTTGMRTQVDQFYAEIAGEKTKAALQHLKSAGKRYTHIPPFGYTYQDSRLVAERHEQEALGIINVCRQQGLGARRTITKLVESGYAGRKSLGVIHRVLKTTS